MELFSLHSLGKLAWHITSLIGKTLRLEQYGSDSDYYSNTCCDSAPARRGGKPLIYALWHGRMFIPFIFRKNCGITVLVSQHGNGELITSTIEVSGNKTVRGSTTRGGTRALAELIRHVKKGAKIAITPDGPKGPRWKLQSGIIYIAVKSGAPIILLAGSAKYAHYFKSWDTFQLPFPFSKAVFVIGEPYFVTGGTDDKNIEFHRAEVEKRLTELTLKADKLAGAPS